MTTREDFTRSVRASLLNMIDGDLPFEPTSWLAFRS